MNSASSPSPKAPITFINARTSFNLNSLEVRWARMQSIRILILFFLKVSTFPLRAMSKRKSGSKLDSSSFYRNVLISFISSISWVQIRQRRVTPFLPSLRLLSNSSSFPWWVGRTNQFWRGERLLSYSSRGQRSRPFSKYSMAYFSRPYWVRKSNLMMVCLPMDLKSISELSASSYILFFLSQNLRLILASSQPLSSMPICNLKSRGAVYFSPSYFTPSLSFVGDSLPLPSIFWGDRFLLPLASQFLSFIINNLGYSKMGMKQKRDQSRLRLPSMSSQRMGYILREVLRPLALRKGRLRFSGRLGGFDFCLVMVKSSPSSKMKSVLKPAELLKVVLDSLKTLISASLSFCSLRSPAKQPMVSYFSSWWRSLR